MNSLSDDEVKKRSLVCMYCWLDCTAYTDMSSVHQKIRKCIDIYNFYVEKQSPMFVEVLEEKQRVAIRKAVFKLVENLLSDSEKSEQVATVPKVAVDVDEHGKEKVRCFVRPKERLGYGWGHPPPASSNPFPPPSPTAFSLFSFWFSFSFFAAENWKQSFHAKKARLRNAHQLFVRTNQHLQRKGSKKH
jgi:hypothetical protein